MKKLVIVVISSVTAALSASPLAAQDNGGSRYYGTLGYTQDEDLDVGAAQARLGGRIGQHFGVEGEFGLGVKSHRERVATIPPFGAKTSVSHAAAVYGVAFLPVTPNAEVFARVGYGTTRYKLNVDCCGTPARTFHQNREALAYGVGAQYYFDGRNGVRVDYTRQDFEKPFKTSDTWAVAYSRRF